MEIEYTKEKEDFTEYRFSVQTEPEYYVPCHLLVPKIKTDKLPLTLCLSGHGAGMHIALGVAKTEKDKKSLLEWPHRAMALRSIKEGRCALVIEARNFGESSLEGYGTSCTEAAKIAILAGRTVIGERVWDAMRILDAVLAAFEFIDSEDIVCTGNSGGGTVAYYLAGIDERIAVATPSCSDENYNDALVFCSDDPKSFGRYNGGVDGAVPITKLKAHAPEVLCENEEYYITTCGWNTKPNPNKGAVSIARLEWD